MIFIFIFFDMFLLYKVANYKNKTISIFGKKAFVVISGSMVPEIQVGDIVIMNGSNDANVGDIIAFRRNSKVIVHRVMQRINLKGKIVYTTKGDNNAIADSGFVDKSMVEGVYLTKIPAIGSVIMYISDNLEGIIAVVIIAVVCKHSIE